MMRMMRLFCVLVCMIATASAHSWLQCADYAQENGRLWNQSYCRGWPRNYQKMFGANGFGADVGFDHRPSGSTACASAPASTDYTTAFPMASYSPGQKVCLAWPPKTHVAANCANPNIKDSGTKIYRSGLNPTSDPTYDQFKQSVVHDFGANTGVAGDGFQNCPNFCAITGTALCTGCFTIPADLALGTYTFLWEWAFNGPTDLYVNCFDVNIVANSGNYVRESFTHLSPDAYKSLLAAGTPDTPVENSPPSSGGNSGGGSGSNDESGDGSSNGGNGSGGDNLSPGASAAIAIFIVLFVSVVIGFVFLVKLGYGTINSKFPFYHSRKPDDANYVAFQDTDS